MDRLLNEITLQIQALPSDSQTQAGRNNVQLSSDTIEAINGVFEILSTNYGNQFNSAFSSMERTNLAKRLWAKHLNSYPKNLLMTVADDIIANENFLPSLAKFKEYCDKAFELYGLPDAHRAYMEACRAPQPKSNYSWSHAAVYYAGLATDWFFLSSEPESKVFPVFKRNYEMLCERVIKGETLDTPMAKALPEEISQPLSGKENLKHLGDLRSKLGL